MDARGRSFTVAVLKRLSVPDFFTPKPAAGDGNSACTRVFQVCVNKRIDFD